ncbi:DnaD domain protein [Ligilactobacillus ruminis]|uniref:helix-turn-helix domain-containing protein n=1 Tax=Ligilactobacillus ruminis TaxID=1623 RepID=UPI001F275565|nr:helix-turn-helix domain-containing protein [Ligilactobacillus ruminis]MCF2543732.1 DnaD domain protein [Ligilactobacillus ruminis]
MKDESFVTVAGWMVNKLQLKGRELLIYAVIYGFSQDGQSWFTGSVRYLAEWAGCSKRTVYTTLQSLLEKKLIRKQVKDVNGVRFCNYQAVKPDAGVVKKLQGGSEKTSPVVVKKLQGGSEKTSAHSIDHSIDNISIEQTDRKAQAATKPSAKEETSGGLPGDTGFAEVVDFYQTNFGLLNSYMAEELRQTYDEWSSQSEEPGGIIIKAMQIALAKNVRNWKFVCGVLRQWEGKARTLADAEALEAEHKNNRTSRSKHAKPGNQKTMENFDDLANKQNAGISMSKTLSDIEALKNQLYG